MMVWIMVVIWLIIKSKTTTLRLHLLKFGRAPGMSNENDNEIYNFRQ